MPYFRKSILKQSASFLYWALFLCISLLGFWACLDIGVGADEEAERATLSINLAAIIGIFSNNPQPYEALLAHPDRYYGIGFHLPALLISQLFKTVFSCLQISTPVENPIIFSHLSVWMCFLGSTLLVRKLLYRLTESNIYSLIGMLCFLLWPYLFGHGLMNIKDTPFMFAWLLCTLIALPPAQRNHTIDVTNFSFNSGRWIALGLATGWLLSIRISGILIFIEYFCLLFSFYLYSNHLVAVKNNFIKNISLKNIFIFALVFLFTLLTLYPIAWKNPLELIHAITYMSHHPWVGTTLTAGRFIAPTTKLYFYLPTWLLVKLPLIVIIGLLICPWILLRSLKKNWIANTCKSFCSTLLIRPRFKRNCDNFCANFGASRPL